MSANVQSMAYAGAMPWHKQGTKVPEGADTAMMIEAAGLGWDVVTKRVYYDDSSGLVEIPNRFAVVRSDNGAALGVVRGSYRPIANRDSFEFFDPAVKAGELVYETAGALGRGETVWVLARVPGAELLKDVDPVTAYLLLVNTHDGSKVLSVGFTPIRVVCQNTLNSAMNGLGEAIRVRHTIGAEDHLAALSGIVRQVLATYKQMGDTFRRMIDKPLTTEQRHEFFCAVAGSGDSTVTKKRVDRLWQIQAGHETIKAEFRPTLWGAFNAATFWIDHEVVAQKRVKDPLQSVWFGRGAQLRDRAVGAAKALLESTPVSVSMAGVN